LQAKSITQTRGTNAARATADAGECKSFTGTSAPARAWGRELETAARGSWAKQGKG
jgi:hypothetical protein